MSAALIVVEGAQEGECKSHLVKNLDKGNRHD